MTPEQQRIAIAEACGYVKRPDGDWYPNGANCGSQGIPDYLNDLNAMHEAEKTLTDEQQKGFALQWLPSVLIINGRKARPKAQEFKFVHATAAQRAKAFLRTLNLWKP